MALETQVLAQDRQNDVAGLNQLKESQPSPLTIELDIGNEKNLHRFTSTQTEIIRLVFADYPIR